MPRFLLMLRSDENPAAGAPPQELYEAIGKSAQQWAEEGVLLDTGGLAPSNTGTRVHLAGGEITATSGPFQDTQSVTAYAIIQVDSAAQAVDRATQFLELHRQHWPEWEGASEVRQIFGPDDTQPAP
jgi:hypothetical protein